jgi:hypothetical protein
MQKQQRHITTPPNQRLPLGRQQALYGGIRAVPLLDTPRRDF